MKYQLIFTESELSNLQIFLERVNLNGKEVGAFVDIVNSINSAKQVDQSQEEEGN